MEIIKKTLVVLVLCSFIMGTVPISVLAQQNSPDNLIFEHEGPDLPSGVEYVTGELIVKFNPEVLNNEIANINSKHGTSVKYTSPHAGFKILHIPKGKTVPEMVEKYNRNPNVEYAEPNYIARASMVPNDYFYVRDAQWNFDNGEYGGINMEEAWDISSDAGAGVIVAVLDTGVAYENYEEDGIEYALAPDLAGTTFVLGRDFVNNDIHPNDDAGHGTHVTGTIAQTTNNDIGVAGIAYNAHIMPVKVLDSSGSGYYSWIADGIRYATDNGAKVISMSLGGKYPSDTLEDALFYAYSHGVTIVCSSGNDGSSTTISYPAAYDAYCIAVGATRYDEEVTYYSNGGASLDLTAPGGQLYERRKMLDQNGDGYWDGILQQTHDGSDYTNFGYYFYMGTSMAAPHVSAVAALVISAGVATTPDEVREVLQSTAEDKGSADWDPYYGYGIVDAYAALNYTSAPNEPPTANANGPYSGTEDAPVDFNGSESYDPDGDALTYHWDFGDGSTGTGESPTHIYTAGGTYNVTLIVNDGKANSLPNTTTANILEVNDPPIADAGPNQTVSVDETVEFDGSGSYDPEETTLSYAWDFGDDSTGTGTEESPTHIYTAGGTYTVTLIVTDGGELTDTDTLIVTVTDEPTDTMYIANIDMSLNKRAVFTHASALVTVVDADGDPVEDAMVTGEWSGLTTDDDSGATDAIGQVLLYSDIFKKAPSGTNFTFTVNSVILEGWIYDTNANIETTDSIEV